MTQTIEITPEQAKLLEQYQRERARLHKYGQDVKTGLRQVNHEPVVPDEAFDELLENLPRETLQHGAGFLEGDGSVNAPRAYNRPQISFSNQDIPVLQYVKDALQLPNEISGPDKDGNYILCIGRQNLIQPLIRVLSPYFCCQRTIEQIRKVYNRCDYAIDFDLSEHEPTIPWFVGFAFDAEGTKIDPRNAQLITDQKDRRPLEKLQRLFNSGTIVKYANQFGTWYEITWSGESFRELIPYILKYSKHQGRLDMLKASLYFRAKEKPDGAWGEFYQRLKEDGCL